MLLNLKPNLKGVLALAGALIFPLAALAQISTVTSGRITPEIGLPGDPEHLSAIKIRLERLAEKILNFSSDPNLIHGKSRHSWSADIWVFHRAVETAALDQQIFEKSQWDLADSLLSMAEDRLAQLSMGDISWTSVPGPLVRGYWSKIDKSAQPYALDIPDGLQVDPLRPRRLDVWLHGRDNRLTELKFIGRQTRSGGPLSLEDGIVLYPYGRYCNAFKFAGEVDVLEAVQAVQNEYSVDVNRQFIRGFSMGGAGCWYLATHYPQMWSGAAPGAGFAETAEYQNFPKKNGSMPPEWEQLLWKWTDATAYAGNLFHVPTVAYSGELDSQIQAANKMDQALSQWNIPLKHLIGPGMGHKYHPEVESQIHAAMNQISAAVSHEVPEQVRLVTYTLQYNKQAWLEVLGLARHWDFSFAGADLDVKGHAIDLRLENITRLGIHFPSGHSPFSMGRSVELRINNQTITADPTSSDRSWAAELVKVGEQWRLVKPGNPDVTAPWLEKRPGLQGPIDAAFMDSFLFVKPSRPGWNARLDEWVDEELRLAELDWLSQFRGAAPVVLDSELTDEMIRNHHLVLWGDPESNLALAKIIQELPIQWEKDFFQYNDISPQSTGPVHQTDQAAPVMIYPNPLNPNKYIVINSGFSFASAGSMSNARQTPKLPDFAVIDLGVNARKRPDEGILEAGFFNENWKLDRSVADRYWNQDSSNNPQWIHVETPSW